MTVAFYLDENVPRQIADGLRLRGVDVLTVQDDGRRNTPDPLLLDRATELARVIFSQDQDFLIEANRRQTEGIYFSGVVFARKIGMTTGDCIRDLEIIAKASDLEDLANQVQYLPL
jgi:hypothetical protein